MGLSPAVAGPKKLKGDRPVKIERKFASFVKSIKFIDSSGKETRGPIEVQRLPHEDPQKLAFSLSIKNKKDVGNVKYAIQPQPAPLSTQMPNKSVAVQKIDGTWGTVLNLSELGKGDYHLILAITIQKKSPQYAYAVVAFTKTVAAYYDGDVEPPPTPGTDGETGGSTGGSDGGSGPGPSFPPTEPDEGLPVAGDDLDGDMVRDDVEAFINALNRTSLEREALISFAKKLQERTLVSGDKAASNQVTVNLLNYDYCLRTRFTDEERRKLAADIQIEQYNTRERLIEYARTQVHFKGSLVELDTDEANWAKYCEE